MTRPFIVLGDKTNHGGTVITADMTFLIHDKPTARVGDMVVCPKCKGTFPIKTGAPDMDAFGMAVAREGDKTACGATLISSQNTTTWSDESSMEGPAADDGAEQASAASVKAALDKSGICLDCLIKAAAAGSSIVVRD